MVIKQLEIIIIIITIEVVVAIAVAIAATIIKSLSLHKFVINTYM